MKRKKLLPKGRSVRDKLNYFFKRSLPSASLKLPVKIVRKSTKVPIPKHPSVKSQRIPVPVLPT